MIYGITGTSNEKAITPNAALKILRALQDLDPEPTEFVSGCAEGVDSFAAIAAHMKWPNAKHTLIVPGTDWYKANSKYMRRYAEDNFFNIIWMPAEDIAAVACMERNDTIVRMSGYLLAFPATGKEVRRSGTWSTIRRMRRAGKAYHIFPLED